MKAIPVVLALTFLLAGCTDPTLNPDSGDQGSSASTPSGTAAITVWVVDPALNPLQGAAVTLSNNNTATSDAEGYARFSNLTAGEYTLLIELEGYRTGRSGANLTDGQSIELEVKLLEDASTQDPSTAEERPDEQFHLRGYFDCSATYLIITGDCALLIDTVTASAGAGTPVGDQTEEEFMLDFPVDFGWKSIAGEMHWDANGPFNGDQMTFALEPTEYDTSGHAPKFARDEGTGPLRWVVHAGEAHESATVSADGDEPDLPNPNGGEVLRTRSYVAGQLLHRPAGTTFLGIGGAVQQQFEVVVTVFYQERAPDDYMVGNA